MSHFSIEGRSGRRSRPRKRRLSRRCTWLTSRNWQEKGSSCSPDRSQTAAICAESSCSESDPWQRRRPSLRPVQTQAGFTVLPNYSFLEAPAMDAFLIPGGFGTRQELHNRRLYDFIRSLPESTMLASVCTGSWIYGKMGLLDGLPATNRKEPDRVEASPAGMVPLDRLAKIAPACRISRARVVDTGRIVTAGGIASRMEMGFHLLRRAGYSEAFCAEVARVMEYQKAYELYRNDIELNG